MPDYTIYHNLIKPKKSENYDIDQITSKNMDLIDSELNKRVKKVAGKDLSDNNFTNKHKKKLEEINLENYISNEDIATEDNVGIIKSNTTNNFNINNEGKPYAKVYELEEYKKKSSASFIGKGVLEKVLDVERNRIQTLEQEREEIAEQMPWNTTEISESIHIEDSAKYSRNKLDLFGNLKQETREGYNLFNEETSVKGYVNGKAGGRYGEFSSDSNVSRTSDYIPIKPSKEYMIIYDYANLSAENDRGYCFYDNEKNLIVSSSTTCYSPTNKKTIITTMENASYIRFSYDINCTKIMLIEGTIEKTYEAYGAMPSIEFESMPVVTTGVQTIKLNDNIIATLDLDATELCKITDSDGNVVAQDRAVYREVDGIWKWQWEKNITKIILNGTENWEKSASYEGFYRYVYEIVSEITYPIPIGINGINSHFKQRVSEAHGGYEYIYVQGYKFGINIYIQVKDITTVEDIKAFLINQYNNNIPVTVYYVSKVAEYEDCTQEQSEVLDKLHKLQLQQGTNNIFVESENGVTTELQLTYMQDNNLIREQEHKALEDRITELEAMILSNASEEV